MMALINLHINFNGNAEEAPIGDSGWGSYFGCFRDKYGIEWIVEFAQN
jgi:PhnB protein